ncbi:alpha/beta hydrolase, putative [Plasmodium gallinaceum]|uniref:Alpha/beta hydrolase, putative n=1 Tax=Plasmodium gallinaceum TaxID=5849 RepID=A0A1J1GSZ3_PLAGA|nr:alpha/beta hydrolase, putative [Plasmodium gallinaceum]CRG95620.1 alpha/beta hydrolase, putative [Plasmodium gallinaceum]
MYHSKKIVQEYVTCSEGNTFIIYSQNLLSSESKIKIDSTSIVMENNNTKNYNNENEILLFLHGLNGSSYQFENLFSHLIHSNYKFMSLDLYGHGKSTLLKNLNKYTEKLYIEQIYDVLKKKNIFNSNFVIIGFSMGCIIAAHLSIDNKIKIKKLCLISAAGLAKPKHRFLQFLLKHNIRFCLRVAKKYSHLIVSEDSIKSEYFDYHNNIEDVNKRYLILKENHEKFMETFLKVITGTKIQNSKKYYSAFLKKNHEVLFIYGKDDNITPCIYTLKFLEKHEKYLNNVKVAIFPECSHLVLSEKCNELIKHLIYFLQNK